MDGNKKMFNIIIFLFLVADIREIHKFWIAMYERYGPIYRLVSPGTAPMVFVVDADECQRINQLTQADPIRPPLESLEILRRKHSDDFFEGKIGIMLE